MAISARRLTSEQYGDMMEKLNEARQMMVDRELYVSQIFDVIESDMTLLGATGVEDQLQDGVAETLEALRAAGIKVRTALAKVNPESVSELPRLDRFGS